MSRHVRPSGDAPEYTDALKAEIERLTAELDAEKEISAALTFDREQLRAELETERCLSFREQVATLEAQLTETRDLAEHWAILAEQRRVELGECRKDAERYRWLRDQSQNENWHAPCAVLGTPDVSYHCGLCGEKVRYGGIKTLLIKIVPFSWIHTCKEAKP